MAFTLPALPYAYDALEPVIDEQTMSIHHTKHHQWYVTKLNAALEDSDYSNRTIEELMTKIDTLPDEIETSVRNNGWWHFNHSLFWTTMIPGGKPMSSEFEQRMIRSFGSIAQAKELFTQAAASQFGSGRAWIAVDGDQLTIESTPNQDNPLMDGRTPILGVDVREHAYYLQYQNRRPDYINARWDNINRQQVENNASA